MSMEGSPLPASAGTPSEDAEKNTKKKQDDDEDLPISWSKFFIYIGSGIGGLIFLWYFRKAKYNLHQTEVLLLERWRSLPFYPPPVRGVSEKNTKLDGKGLPPDLVAAFSEWFVHTDLLESGGVVRNDVLELFQELGLDGKHKAAQDFLQTGEGQLEEHRRLAAAGLQESIALLALMAFPEDGSPCLLGDAAVAYLCQKLPQRSASVMDGATALRQFQAGGRVPVNALGQGPKSAAAALGSPLAGTSAKTRSSAAAHEEISMGGVSDSEMHRLEDARLARIEDGLLARLDRQGSLSPAEESRLQDIREQRMKL